MGSISHELAYEESPIRSQSKPNLSKNEASLPGTPLESGKKSQSIPGASSRRHFTTDPDTPDLFNFEDRSPETVKDLLDPSGKFEEKASGFPNRSRIATPRVTPHRVATSTNIINPVVKGEPPPLFTSLPCRASD
jgi:hypothetical protein